MASISCVVKQASGRIGCEVREQSISPDCLFGNALGNFLPEGLRMLDSGDCSSQEAGL